MSAPTDSEIIEALPSSGEARGLRELAAQLGTTSRKLGVRVERLAELGKLLIDRPTGGYRSGERQIRRDGDTVESLRVRLAAAQARHPRSDDMNPYSDLPLTYLVDVDDLRWAIELVHGSSADDENIADAIAWLTEPGFVVGDE